MPLAFVNLLDLLADPGSSWIFIPLTALWIPIIAIAMEPIKQRMRAAERREARQTYERIAREKLEVVKAGITMGYSQQELRELDERLERLIGEDKLKTLLDAGKLSRLDKQMELADQNDLEAAMSMSRGKTTG